MTPRSIAFAGLIVSALGFGGCAQQPQQFAAAGHPKEYFPSSVYGPASRRVIAEGQPVPRGGGQYLVGKPYVVAGHTYVPSDRPIVQVGAASWYGDAFHGRLTANGEIYDRDGFTAAHPTMPLPSYARVTNLRNNASMIVRVNDRGPYASNRIMDVSRRVAEALDFKRYGTAKLKVEYVGRASLAGSDDRRLLATLRNDRPAPWGGEPTMVATAGPPAQVASNGPYAPSPAAGERHDESRRPDVLVSYKAPIRRRADDRLPRVALENETRPRPRETRAPREAGGGTIVSRDTTRAERTRAVARLEPPRREEGRRAVVAAVRRADGARPRLTQRDDPKTAAQARDYALQALLPGGRQAGRGKLASSLGETRRDASGHGRVQMARARDD